MGQQPNTIADDRRARRSARLWPAALTVALALTGCGSSSVATTSSSPAPPATETGPPHVAMKALEFTPGALRARVGQVVTFFNRDTSPHNVTYVSGPRFTSSSTIRPERHFALRLRQAGTIHYICTLHPWMKATLVVSP